MDVTVEYWLLIAAVLLTAAMGAALWLFSRQVARDKDNRDDRMERALVTARKAAGKKPGNGKPRRWVRARMQLVMLLTEAGGNRPDRGRFEEALAILAEAIPILKAQGLTPELATAIYYRGRAEWGLGGLEPGWEQLEAAVASFREVLAIEPWPRHLLRGVVTSLPAVILVDIGDRKDDIAAIEEGVALAREAVEVARARVRIDKSIAQRNLSHALGMLGRKTVNPAMLEEAIEVAHAAIEGIKQKTYPGHWVACQANLGYALGALGELRGDAAMLEEALSVMEAARESGDMKWRREGHVMLAQNTGGVRLALSRLRRDHAMLRRAVGDLAESLDSFTELALPFGQAETSRMLGQTLAALGEMERDNELLEQAADCYRRALEIFSRAGATRHAAETGELMRRLEDAGKPDTDDGVTQHQPLYIVR
jgi:tetratricopeptide (TPR) repeat protein